MPALPDAPQLEYVSAQLAAAALERAAGSTVALDQMAQSWFPDHDAIDRRRIVRDLARGLEAHRLLVIQRAERLVKSGKAVCPGGAISGQRNEAVPAG